MFLTYPNFIRWFTIFIITLLVLTACFSQTNQAPPTSSPVPPSPGIKTTLSPSSTATLILGWTATYTPSPTPCLGIAPRVVSTPVIETAFRWPYGEASIPSISIRGMECAAPQEIVRQLMLQWLETIKRDSPNQSCGLEDYVLGPIKIMRNTNTPHYDIVATVGYQVKPGKFIECGWIADRGVLEKDGWIGTGDIFGVYRKNGNFRLIIAPDAKP